RDLRAPPCGWTLLVALVTLLDAWTPRSSGELVPHDHPSTGPPGDGRHVRQDIGRSLRERHHQDPCEQLGSAAGARLLHPLERALPQEGGMISLLQEIEEPEV